MKAVDEIRRRKEEVKEGIAVQRKSLLMKAARSAADLRTTLQNEERVLLATRTKEFFLRKAKAETDKFAMLRSLQMKKMVVLAKKTRSAMGIKRASIRNEQEVALLRSIVNKPIKSTKLL
jgi:hypothetical protein